MKQPTTKRFGPKFLIALFVVSLPFLYALTPWRYWGNPPIEAPVSPNVSPYDVSLSSDASMALFGGNQKAAWLMDLTSGTVIRRFPVKSNMICSVDLTPDKKTAAICESNGTVSLWNAEDGSRIARYSVYEKIDDPDIDDVNMTRYQVALSPDASSLLLKDKYRGLKLLDARRGKTLRTLNDTGASDLSWFDFSPRGDVAYAFKNEKSSVEIIPLNGDAPKEINVPPFALRSAIVTPDGKHLLLGGEDGVIRVWDVASQKVVRRLRCPDPVCAMYVSLDGKLLYAGGFVGKVSVWNLERFQYVRTFFKASNSIAAIGVSSGASEAVVVDRKGSIWNWDADQQKNVWSIDGFQFNKQKQISALPKTTVTPAPSPVVDSRKAVDVQAILDRPIDWPKDLNGARLDETIDYIASQIDVPISHFLVRNSVNRAGQPFIFSFWFEEALKQNSLDFIVQTDGTIRFGRTETLAQYRNLDSGKTLYDVPALSKTIPNQPRYVYIEDIAEAIRSVTDVSITIEDDIYSKITVKRGRETPRRFLERILIPNGLDYCIDGGMIRVEWPDNSVGGNKDNVFVASQTQPSLNIEEGFTKAQLDEMERNTDLRLTPNELAALIVNYHARFETSRFQYSGVDRCSYYRGERYGQTHNYSFVQVAKEILQMRRAGIDKFPERIRSKKRKERFLEWDQISDEQLEAYIKNVERLYAGYTRSGTRIYTVGKHDRSLEALWPNERPDRCVYYVNEKNEGISYFPRNEKLVSDHGRSHFCETPADPCRFGSDLDWFLLQDNMISSIDWPRRRLRMVTVDDTNFSYTYEFTLLDGHNAYWKRCDVILSGRILRRIDCDDFIDVSGMLVPQTVSVQDSNGYEFINYTLNASEGLSPMSGNQKKVRIYDGFRTGDVRHDYQLKLVEAQVNQPVKEIDVALDRPLHKKETTP